MIVSLFLTGMIMSHAQAAQYTVDEGKLHTGGKAQVEVLPETTDHFVVKFSYEITKKPFVPVPSNVLKGEKTFELPREFHDESGYQLLEEKKVLEVDKAMVNFLGRTDKNGYKVEILPKNGKSRIEIVYHPSLPGAGWQYVKIKFLGNIPLLSGYETQANLKS